MDTPAIRHIRRPEDLDELLSPGRARPVLIFKHSTTCPVSARAHRELQEYLKQGTNGVDVALVRVREERPLSQALAERLQVKHESPQAILVQGGRAVWHASHGNITAERLREVTATRAG